ncbi:CLUMA_CG007207, isoform A [Clunio marinus]|uniref:CLUMA_CG007207, isoform A n=1 Tax=Clunio marinus TaxID=568069 RepID=A0A1J1I488_9DIPT|nr:CLUMA_CG007207, isoform A [Clunio marinus]
MIKTRTLAISFLNTKVEMKCSCSLNVDEQMPKRLGTGFFTVLEAKAMELLQTAVYHQVKL